MAEFEIAAEPVPVRRPGVWVIGVEEVWESSWTGSVIGRTNVGSNLCKNSSGQGERGIDGKAERYLNASHRSSTHDTQFETMISPVLGLQLSSIWFRLYKAE